MTVRRIARRLQRSVVPILMAWAALLPAAASADLTKIAGPTTVRNENRLLVKLDAAFDSVNNVYLVVWGTQSAGPVNGQFVDVNGAP
ncbi:MAG: hypothetical protein IT184_07995, partial [Acidobacteria bacterium]|nr:hypothetical protein [Acidobacteriota bacterium]